MAHHHYKVANLEKYEMIHSHMIFKTVLLIFVSRLSDSQGISPALFARSLLQNVYSDSSMVKKCFKDTTIIEDKELAYQVFMVK